ncbi:MAG: hypothetical protein AAB303_04405, partial [Chloroflexota bacterium]
MVDKITSLEQLEAYYRPGLGVEQDLAPNYPNADRTNILVFCDAIGDNNPLFINEGYAKKGPHRGITAPPT